MFNFSHYRMQRKPKVRSLMSVSDSTLYNRINSGLFPPPISLGGRASGWIEHEVLTVLKAMRQGKSQNEIKEIVRTLISERSTEYGDSHE